MKRTRWRLLVACLAVAGAAIAVAGGSAGNRVLNATFDSGGSVTYGKTIAYTATLTNDNKANFTHVTFRQTRPVATFNGQAFFAAFVTSSCGALDLKGDTDPSNDELVCEFGDLTPGAPAEELTSVWTAPTIPSGTGCAACLKSTGTWLIKEGKATNLNETVVFTEDAELLGNDGTAELLRATSYELPNQCDQPGEVNLSTNQALSKDNAISSSFCLPPFAADATHLGLLTSITELKSNPRHSEVCIAALGETCAGTYVAADFGPGVVKYLFRLFGPGIKGGPINDVRHNGELLTQATCEREVNPECVVSITYDQSTQIWTVITTSETNGPWDF